MNWILQDKSDIFNHYIHSEYKSLNGFDIELFIKKYNSEIVGFELYLTDFSPLSFIAVDIGDIDFFIKKFSIENTNSLEDTIFIIADRLIKLFYF